MNENFGQLSGVEVGRTNGGGVVRVQGLRGHGILAGIEVEGERRPELACREQTQRPTIYIDKAANINYPVNHRYGTYLGHARMVSTVCIWSVAYSTCQCHTFTASEAIYLLHIETVTEMGGGSFSNRIGPMRSANPNRI